MECRRCGNLMVRGTKFCPYCGEKVEGYCPECGAEVESSALYCSECGSNLKDPWVSMEQYKNDDDSLLYYLGIDEFITKIKKKNISKIILTTFALVLGGCWFAGSLSKEILDNSDSSVESIESYATKDLEQEEEFQYKEFSQETERNVEENNNEYSETQQISLIDNNDYILPDSAQRYLTVDELRRLDAATLRLARNEIYARHGRFFQTEDLNAYFSTKSWYQGYLSAEDFNDAVFNAYEKANLDLIRSIEEGKKSDTESIGTQIKIPREQQYEINIFLSNFAEQYFGNLTDFDVATPDINVLVSFCYSYAKINTNYEYEYINLPNERWGNVTYEIYSLEQCNKVMDRFFGLTFTDDELRAAYIETENSFYKDSYFYFTAADGETYARFAVANTMHMDSYGNYVVDFDIYEMEQDLYWELGGIEKKYYELSSDEVQNTVGVSKVAKGRAVVTPFQYNMRDTYRLKAYYVAKQ